MHLGLSIQKMGGLIFSLLLGGDNIFHLLLCCMLQMECGDLSLLDKNEFELMVDGQNNKCLTTR